MRQVSSVLTAGIIVSVLSPLMAGSDFDSWKSATSKEGGFSIAFPDTPYVQTNFLLYRKGDGKPFWMMAIWQLRKEPHNREAESDFLAGGQLGILDNSKGTLLKETAIEFSGRPGREFTFKSSKFGFSRIRILLSKDRFYILSFHAESEELLKSKNAEYYFKSFTLSK